MSLPLTHAGLSAPGISAALDLKFASTLSLTSSSGITPSFSRASSGSYFDSAGVLRYASVNQVLYSEDFGNAAWVKQNVSVSTNQITAPDGKTTADKFTENVANTFFNIYNGTAVSHSAGATVTASGYFKYGTRRYIQFILGPAANGVSAVVDLLNGIITATGSSGSATYTASSITSVGDGWYRVSVTGTLPSANTGYYDLFSSNTPSFVNPYPTFSSSGEYTYIWGAQLEASSTVGTYVPTTSAANSAPRFDHTYNGTSWVSRGLLLEEQRVNSFQYSEDFSNAFWTKLNASITTSSGTSPDGANTANKITDDSTNGTHRIYRGNVGTAGQPCTTSFYLKAGTARYAIVLNSDNADWRAYVVADLQTGTITQSGVMNAATGASYIGSSITNCGNGWYRVSVSGTNQNGDANYYGQVALSNSATPGTIPSYVGTGSYIYAVMAQMELNSSFATSYIKTTSGTATRSADVCQITGGDFSSFWSASEGSFAAELDLAAPVTGITYYPFYFGASDSATNTKRLFYFSDIPTGTSSLYVSDGTTTSKLTTTTIPGNSTPFKAAMCYKTDDLAISLNGASVVTDLSQPIPTGLDRLQIGSNPSANNFNGHIARLRYFNKRLPNADLRYLTGGSRGFQPDNINGLQLWLDASDSSTLFQSSGGSAASADGDPVGYWGDKSGNGRNATQSSGVNKPTFKTNIQNGKPIVRLDGNDRLALASTLQNEPRTFAIVYKKTITSSPFIAVGHSVNTESGDIIDWTDGNVYTVGATRLGYSSSGHNTSFVVFVTTIDATGLVFSQRKNTTSQSVATGATVGVATLNQIGARATSYGRGDIAEIVVYDSVLSVSDRMALESYLNAKWSIY